MTEVKEFDRRLRFKKYLAMDDARTQAMAQIKSPNNSHFGMPIRSEYKNEEGTVLKARIKVVPAGSQDMTRTPETTITKLLSLRPRRPPRSNESGLTSSHSYSNISQSTQVNNGNTHQPSLPTHPMPLALPLPPLFSQGARVVSDEHSLPSRPSSARSPSTYDDSGQVVAATSASEAILGNIMPDTLNSQLAANLGTGLIHSEVRFIETSIRSPSRVTPTSTSARLASWTPTVEEGAYQIVGTPISTGQRFRIYNDSLPASLQPQTPQNLPEARHQSRLRGAYTAPISRVEARSFNHSGTVRARESRARSPAGMETPGFRGLYGGIENSDDPNSPEEGSRLNETEDGDDRDN